MKRILSFFLTVLVSYSLHAQRAEMERVVITTTQLPSKPFPLEIKKYNFKVMNSTQLPLPQTETVNGQLKIDGFEFSSTEPDVTMLVYLDNYTEKISTTPVKGLSETKYAYLITASMDVKLSFLTGDKRFEFYQTSKLLKSDDTQHVYKSSLTYSTEADAMAAGNKDESELKRVKVQCMENCLARIREYVKYTHGYPVVERSIPVWSMKAKSYDYTDMDNAQEKAIAGLKSYSDNGLNDENKQLFHEAIGIWEKVLQEYNADDKKARINPKNVGALYANLALTKHWLQNETEALLYVNLLSKSRGSSVADMISTIIRDDIAGREQDEKRKSNTLFIEKKKSSYYVSPDFLVNRHSHRISSIQKNNSFNKNLPDERRHFEYLENGLLSSVYTESYNPSTKSWEKRRDIHTIKYDHDRSVMYIYDQKSSTIPLMIRKFKDGKLVYQKSRVNTNDSSVVKLYYNASGQLERYVINPHLKTPDAEVRYQYTNGRMSNKEILKKWNNELKSYSRDEFVWSGNKLERVSRFFTGETGKYSDKSNVVAYRYDGRGFLVGMSYVGFEDQTFEVDESGNIVKIHKRADDGGGKSPTYIWEPGAGNALNYTTKIDDLTGPENIPSVY